MLASRAGGDDLFAVDPHQPAAGDVGSDRARRTRHPGRSVGHRRARARARLRMLRGAIIGLGKVALEVHAPAWARHDVAIVAVSDTDPARRAVSAAALPAARWYDSADELLTREPLDFVDIFTDHDWHQFYLLGSWITETPTSLSARLERRRPGASLVEDTATVHLTFPDATAEIFLTWAADRRDNVAELIGTDGRITLQAE